MIRRKGIKEKILLEYGNLLVNTSRKSMTDETRQGPHNLRTYQRAVGDRSMLSVMTGR